MKPVQQYDEIIKSNLVDEIIFIQGKPYRVVHRSPAEHDYMKKEVRYTCKYTVEGVEPA